MTTRRTPQAPRNPSEGSGEPDGVPDEEKRPPRWGLRTLGFLLLAIIALGTSGARGYHTLPSAVCTFVGLGGAVYSTVRGVRATMNMDIRAARRQ